MKKFNLLSILLLGGMLCFGYSSCSDDDDEPDGIEGGNNQPAEKILAVGFDTEKPVKRINYFHPENPEYPMQSLSFTWSGKNITSMSLEGYASENKFVTLEKYEYLYKGREITCNYYQRDWDQEKLVLPDYGVSTVLLDNEGYAKSCTNKVPSTDEYTEQSKKIDYVKILKYEVERDASHRVILFITSKQNEYKPKDLQWMKEHLDLQYDPTAVHRDSMSFEYDAAGNTIGYTSEFTDIPNKNGFNLFCMHAFHYPRSRYSLCMGPYDLFNVVKTGNLPSNFEHEVYRYELDKEGYVKKVYDLRNYEEVKLEEVPYSIFEY